MKKKTTEATPTNKPQKQTQKLRKFCGGVKSQSGIKAGYYFLAGVPNFPA
ncbi:hypothetical protein [Candidatus Parabeggiatoa sp. HSG14]|nr:hypothetical protein [Thiotrichales bacterium HSG14]